jgi:hypothetical protein
MQQASEALPTPAAATFAAMLSALADPEKKRDTGWNDDELADDVATLSYERALRTHSRYRSADFDDRPLAQSVAPSPVDCYETLPLEALPAADLVSQRATSTTYPGSPPETSAGPSTAVEKNLKRSSITIRLSSAECAQLRARAAEAGLTVSAYMRSCTFEAESLRALVKDTLAELQSAKTGAKTVSDTTAKRSGLGWMSRLLPRSHSRQRVAAA